MEKEKYLALLLIFAFIIVGTLVGISIARLNINSDSEDGKDDDGDNNKENEEDNNNDNEPSEKINETNNDDTEDDQINSIDIDYNETEAPSIIVMIGDGMGFSHIDLGNLVEYGPNKTSCFYEFPYITNTSTFNYYNKITDSAAAGTAISTGIKTENKRVSVDVNGTVLKTILEFAEEKGYNTGLVVSSDMRHATPATFAAHNESRYNSFDLGRDMANQEIELLFGGGESNDLFGQQVDYMVDNFNYTFISNSSELKGLKTLKTLGLFAENGLMREMDRNENTTKPSLFEMSLKAINLLENQTDPYFLMIEGSQIDWASHSNDKGYLAHEIIAFEKIVRYIKNLATEDPTLQILITADHETGGLSISSYDFKTELPNENDTLETLIEKRTNRTREIDVSWSSTGHTNKKVILTGMGEFMKPILEAQHLVDIFPILNNTLNYTITDKQTETQAVFEIELNIYQKFSTRFAESYFLRNMMFLFFDPHLFFNLLPFILRFFEKYRF